MTVVLIYTLISMLLLLLGWREINIQERICNVIIALVLPVGGFILVVILYLLRNKAYRTINDDDELGNHMILFTDRVNKEKEVNVLSLEESLLNDDIAVKRKQLLEALKRDASKYIDKLHIALTDKDVETSHYAASAIDRISRELNFKLQEFAVEFEKNPDDGELASGYLNILNEFISSRLVDEQTLKRYVVERIRVIERLIELGIRTEKNFETLVLDCLEVDFVDKAFKAAEAFMETFETESAYLTKMEFYYKTNDIKGLQSTLNDLKNSPVRLSYEGINVVRVWMRDK